VNAEIKARWVQALRSGEYKQGQGYLSQGGRFCCLGVLCDLHAKETGTAWERDEAAGISVYLNTDLMLPLTVMEWAGLKSECPSVNQVTLSRMNDAINEDTDGPRHDFNDIAQVIEDNL
jgi:hypothetical protein